MSSIHDSCAICDRRIDVWGRDGVFCGECALDVEIDALWQQIEPLLTRHNQLVVERSALRTKAA